MRGASFFSSLRRFATAQRPPTGGAIQQARVQPSLIGSVQGRVASQSAGFLPRGGQLSASPPRMWMRGATTVFDSGSAAGSTQGVGGSDQSADCSDRPLKGILRPPSEESGGVTKSSGRSVRLAEQLSVRVIAPRDASMRARPGPIYTRAYRRQAKKEAWDTQSSETQTNTRRNRNQLNAEGLKTRTELRSAARCANSTAGLYVAPRQSVVLPAPASAPSSTSTNTQGSCSPQRRYQYIPETSV